MTSGDSVFVEHFIPAEDGLQLYAREYGADLGGTPVVCLAGLSRNSRDFHLLAAHLSSRPANPHRVIALDYRGRGRSDRDPDSSHYQLPIEARDILTVCAAMGVDKANFIGTSRGGLILHLLAASRPDVINGVVLNDIGPVIEHAGLLAIRDYLSKPAVFVDWESATRYLQQLHGAAFPALRNSDWEEMAHAIYRRQPEGIVADYDPALAETLKNLEPDTPLPDLWALFEKLFAFPLLVVRGEGSSILSRETAVEMIERHPNAKIVTIEGQGHAPLLHLDPARHAIDGFLDQLC